MGSIRRAVKSITMTTTVEGSSPSTVESDDYYAINAATIAALIVAVNCLDCSRHTILRDYCIIDGYYLHLHDDYCMTTTK